MTTIYSPSFLSVITYPVLTHVHLFIIVQGTLRNNIIYVLQLWRRLQFNPYLVLLNITVLGCWQWLGIATVLPRYCHTIATLAATPHSSCHPRDATLSVQSMMDPLKIFMIVMQAALATLATRTCFVVTIGVVKAVLLLCKCINKLFTCQGCMYFNV